ncbi:glycoside hydrolase family 55 protein [Neobacillus drentensis]|uniref:glycoside hydrolase family 55 protein n=1 Tax=Neobacillus drentensis TaxID=220684 RepID=UPI001F1D8620|nr:glycoside hydrolase family 55 protein [Neobacillus drentensis]ULT56771.1 glycoside hydrolase family 55 protein [Neobacillus drentensis]
MKKKPSLSNENMQSDYGRRNFVYGLFLGILSFLTAFLFKKDSGFMRLQKNPDSQLANKAAQLNSMFINVLYPPSPLNALKGDGASENMTDVQAIFNSIQNTGGTVFFPKGTYKFSTTVNVYDGTTILGGGKKPTNGQPTILDFTAITGENAGIYMNDASDVNLKDFYLYGTQTGSGNDISLAGNCRRINIENIILNTKTTGNGIGTGESLIGSKWSNIVVVGAGTGFYLSPASTSTSLYNCYANACTNFGFNIQGTYCSLYSCGADSNAHYGYVVKNGNQVGLYSCGGEGNGREAILLINATGIDVLSFRSVSNNSGASGFYPSFMDIQNSNQILLSNCQDSSPNSATSFSLTSTTEDSGSRITIINPNFAKPINSRLLNVPRIDGAFYPSTLAATNAQNNSIFIDLADGKLKFKDKSGTVNLLY